MTENTVRGRFVWHELITPDPAAAHRYYNDVFHWKTAQWEANPDYTMFASGGERIGGTAELTQGTPRWLHYIGTPDLDATLDQAVSLGAKVLGEPTAIADDSRYAVLSDPQGAEFALYSSARDPGPDRTPRRGEFSWLELATTEAEAALHFYGALFGWERLAVHDMGPMGFYYVFGNLGRNIGGAFNKPDAMPGPPVWLGYIRGKDMDSVVTRANAGGGRLINGPMEVPGGDWIAQFLDPHGAIFATHILKDDMEAARRRSEAEPPSSEPVAKSAARTARPARKKAVPRRSATKKSPTNKSGTNKSTAARKTATRKTARKTSRPAKKKAAAKSGKRPARKASTVRSRSQKVHKSKTRSQTVGRKKSAARKAVRPKKGK